MILFENSGRYELVSDANQFTVRRYEMVDKIDFKTREATGEKVEKVTWERYYGTLKNAIDGAINACIRDKVSKNEFNTLREIADEIRKLEKIIKEAVG